MADDRPKASDEVEELEDLEVDGEDAGDVKGGLGLAGNNTYSGPTTLNTGN